MNNYIPRHGEQLTLFPELKQVSLPIIDQNDSRTKSAPPPTFLEVAQNIDWNAFNREMQQDSIKLYSQSPGDKKLFGPGSFPGGKYPWSP